MTMDKNKSSEEDPYAGFRFKVTYNGTIAGVTEVSGIKSKTDFQKVREGGNNVFEHAMILAHQFPEMLSLKKVFFKKSKDFYDWVHGVHSGAGEYKRSPIMLELQDQDGSTVGTYNFENCVPAEYEGPSFNAKGGEISVESIKFHYDCFEYKPKE